MLFNRKYRHIIDDDVDAVPDAAIPVALRYVCLFALGIWRAKLKNISCIPKELQTLIILLHKRTDYKNAYTSSGRD